MEAKEIRKKLITKGAEQMKQERKEWKMKDFRQGREEGTMKRAEYCARCFSLRITLRYYKWRHWVPPKRQ
jgi:hypothetical protein